MNLLRRFSFPIVGFAVMALLLTLAAPRAAHAVVAALVQVVNTTANPAVTQDTSKQASQILTLSCRLQGSSTPSALSCFQIDGHGLQSTTQYTVPSTTHFILTSLDYFPGFSSSGPAELDLIDQTTLPISRTRH